MFKLFKTVLLIVALALTIGCASTFHLRDAYDETKVYDAITLPENCVELADDGSTREWTMVAQIKKPATSPLTGDVVIFVSMSDDGTIQYAMLVYGEGRDASLTIKILALARVALDGSSSTIFWYGRDTDYRVVDKPTFEQLLDEFVAGK
jgi:hypothetical protein